MEYFYEVSILRANHLQCIDPAHDLTSAFVILKVNNSEIGRTDSINKT